MYQDNTTMKQRVEQFDLKHGGRDAALRDGEHYLFPNGARRHTNPLGLLEDPPEYNPHRLPPHVSEDAITLEVLRRRLRYCEVKVELAVKAFNAQRHSMANTDYSDEDLDELARLQNEVKAARAEQKLVEAEWDEHPIVRQRAFSQQHEAAHKARIAEKNSKLKSMRV